MTITNNPEHSAFPRQSGDYPGISTRLWVATHLLTGLFLDPRLDIDSGDDVEYARNLAVEQADKLIAECNLG